MSTVRRALTLLGTLLLGGGLTLLWSPVAGAATASSTFTYTPATNGLLGLGAGPATEGASPTDAVIAGQTVTFTNGDPAAAIRVDSVGSNWSYSVQVPASSSVSRVFATAGTFAFRAVGPDARPVLGPAPSGTATGTVIVKAASPAPGGSHPPVTHPTSTAPGSAPLSIGYGGVVGGIAPQSTGSGGGPATIVASYPTSTAPDGVPTTLYTTYTPTPSPVAFAGGGDGGGDGGGSERALGLVAAITAVLLAGLVAAFAKLLLAHPASREASRHR